MTITFSWLNEAQFKVQLKEQLYDKLSDRLKIDSWIPWGQFFLTKIRKRIYLKTPLFSHNQPKDT